MRFFRSLASFLKIVEGRPCIPPFKSPNSTFTVTLNLQIDVSLNKHRCELVKHSNQMNHLILRLPHSKASAISGTKSPLTDMFKYS
ncbi:hypothetical protein MUGA111182_20945 [Mucilaginibacter galii]